MRARNVCGAALAATLALTLAACDRSDQTAGERTAARTPPPTATSTAPGASEQETWPLSEASGPSTQSSSPGGVNSAETAKGSDAPMSSMDRHAETKAMPQPGQANDHSTVAQDPKAPK